jgi:DNA-binding CsgD family transcriptional regulator
MNEFTKLYDQGLNDVQIAKILGKSPETIRQLRVKLNLAKNFSYDQFKTIDETKVLELVNNGLKDREIAVQLSASIDGIYSVRKRLGLERKSFCTAKTIIPTKEQLEILTGCLLGDGSLSLSQKSLNPRFSCMHGLKQKEYCYWKFQKLESLEMKYKESIRKIADPRNGRFYESAEIRSLANTEFLEIYNNLYINRKKVITKDFLKNYTALSLAVHYMDDGTISGTSYSIATNGFSLEDIEVFRGHLLTNFGLDFKLHKNGSIYFPAKYKTLFNFIVSPYIHKSMKYKIVS